MSVRFPILFVLLVLGTMPAGISANAGTEAFAPKSHGIERYAAIWKRSPFIVETVAGPSLNVGLAAKYSLVGLASLAGNPIVFLVDKTNMDAGKNRILVAKGKANDQGVELVSVVMDGDPRKSSAVVRQGGQQATLFFDVNTLAPQGPNLVPGAVPPPPSAMMRPPTMPQPPPSAQSVPAPLPNGAAVAPAAPTPARRIIRPAPVNLN